MAGNADRDTRAAVTVLLLDSEGHPLGSGVVVQAMSGGHWVATNRHVVDGLSHVCVVAHAQPVHAAVVMPEAGTPEQQKIDLALLWWPLHQVQSRPVASIQADIPHNVPLPLVVASGYPTSTTQKLQKLGYVEATGVLLPLLQQPLQGGFALAYTADVRKGMSGGGIFMGQQLIGLNGVHPHPLWPGQWLQADGRPVPADLNTRLESVALGIPVSSIRQLIQTTRLPASHRLMAHSSLMCKKSL